MTYMLDVALRLLDGCPSTSRGANINGMDNLFFAAAADFLPAFLPAPRDEQVLQTTLNDDVLIYIRQKALVRRALGILPSTYVPAPADTAPSRQPPRPGVVPADHPYRGDLLVCTWNAQALFAADAGRHGHKWRTLHRLLRQHDAVLVTETHGTAESLLLAEAPRGAQA
eukprot:9066257-Pyramimonas_sp.AAC.2